jgi:hypothetical protein
MSQNPRVEEGENGSEDDENHFDIVFVLPKALAFVKPIKGCYFIRS